MSKEIEVVENIFEENDRIAAKINSLLTENKVYCINVLGAPGVGKTSVMKKVFEKAPFTSFVIEGDIESDIDTETLNNLGIKTVQINTHGACHLDAPSIENALKDVRDIKNGVLFIENIGNLVCPAEFNIGEHAKMLIVSTTDGSDKPYKYPLAFEKANLIILNKCDLIPYLDFDYDFFLKGILAQNKNATVLSVSSKTGEGFDAVVEWIESNVSRI